VKKYCQWGGRLHRLSFVKLPESASVKEKRFTKGEIEIILGVGRDDPGKGAARKEKS